MGPGFGSPAGPGSPVGLPEARRGPGPLAGPGSPVGPPETPRRAPGRGPASDLVDSRGGRSGLTDSRGGQSGLTDSRGGQGGLTDSRGGPGGLADPRRGPGSPAGPGGAADPRKPPPRPARARAGAAAPAKAPPKAPPGAPGRPGAVPPPRPRPAAVHPAWQRVHINPHLSKRWRTILGVLGVILVLSVCGIGSWLIVLDEQQGVQAQANNASPKPSVLPVDISSREIDPNPLTSAEVFPTDSIVIDPAKPNEAYKIIAKQELTDCRTSTKGEVSALIQGLGCSQVVRATMRSPSDYLVTGGIFNLDTVGSAEKAWSSIREMVDQQKGGFLGYAPTSDKNTRPLVLAATVVGWNMKGHYLAFCVIARSDGQEIPDRDPFASQIMWDIIEIYLKGQILEARATDPVPASGPPPSAAPTG